MPRGNISYDFTECLYAAGNIEAGELSGTVSIDYDRDGSWSVDAICLDGWDKTARKFNSSVTVPKDSEVYRVLHERLTTGRTAEFIQSEVDEAREEDRRPDPDYLRDLRREFA
jgi:hypothetical protein